MWLGVGRKVVAVEQFAKLWRTPFEQEVLEEGRVRRERWNGRG